MIRKMCRLEHQRDEPHPAMRQVSHVVLEAHLLLTRLGAKVDNLKRPNCRESELQQKEVSAQMVSPALAAGAVRHSGWDRSCFKLVRGSCVAGSQPDKSEGGKM